MESEFGDGRAPALCRPTSVCREFGVSRKTGYKIFDRYKAHGLEALSDRSRRPVRYANQLSQQVETLVVRLKAENQARIECRILRAVRGVSSACLPSG